MNSLRNMADRVRDLPLIDVASHLGGEQDLYDQQRWGFPGCTVWLGKGEDSHRFYDHLAGKGGGGAIDLAMHVLRCDFKQAVSTLVTLAGNFALSKKAPAAKLSGTDGAAFLQPKAFLQHISRLVDYLTKTRGLPEHVIEPLIDQGVIYPDSRRNAVFLCHDPEGSITGAELRGTSSTPFKGMVPGSRRGIGFFTVSQPQPAELVIVESALDAISYRALFPSAAATIVSTAGVMPNCPALLVLAKKLGVIDIVIAYDNDVAGDTAAEQLMAALSGTGLTLHRRVPQEKDWNDILMNSDIGSGTRTIR